MLLGALLAAGPTSLSAQQSDDDIEAPEVRRVEFKGVKNLDEDELRESISTEESECRSLLLKIFVCWYWKPDAVYERNYLDEQEFRRDVLRAKVFYWQRGYRDAQVDTVRSPVEDGKVTVTFRVTEGPPTLVQRVEVVRPESLLTNRAMRRLVLVRAGNAFNTFRLDSTIARLKEAMWQRGYADAEITAQAEVDTATHTARIAMTVEPNARTVVGAIHIHGDSNVSQQAIRNSLLFEPDDVFKLDDLVRSQRALYESGLFRRAALYVVPSASTDQPCARFGGTAAIDDDEGRPTADSLKLIEVCVEEARLREVRASGGFNTIEFFQVEGRFSHYNFLGGARRLDLRATLGNLGAGQLNDRLFFKKIRSGADQARFLAPTWLASADVRQRWFMSPRNTLGAGVFAHRRSTPGIFVDRGYGTSATLTREVAIRVPVSSSYRFEITTVDAGDVYFCVNYGVCDRGTIEALRQRQRLSPFQVIATPDKANDPFSPTTGWRGRVELDHASAATFSDFHYNRAFVEASVYRRMGQRGVLATRLRGGWVGALGSTSEATGVGDEFGGILHPRKRFYSGGSQSVRGYGENQLGPRVLTVPATTLRGDDGSRCDAADIRQCDPNGTTTDAEGNEVPAYAERDFTPRALGGNALLEGSVELRYPIRGNFFGAVFVDAGYVRGRPLAGGLQADGAVTPGFGVRYKSPVGPIRVDLGINPFLTEKLPVITEEVLADGTRRLVQLRDADGRVLTRTYIPGRDAGKWAKLMQRLTLHLSIGEAF